jgi:hypothetical protein
MARLPILFKMSRINTYQETLAIVIVRINATTRTPFYTKNYNPVSCTLNAHKPTIIDFIVVFVVFTKFIEYCYYIPNAFVYIPHLYRHTVLPLNKTSKP